MYILYFIFYYYKTRYYSFSISNMVSKQYEQFQTDDGIYIEQFNHHHHITRLNYILLHQQHAEYDINIFHFLIFYTSFSISINIFQFKVQFCLDSQHTKVEIRKKRSYQLLTPFWLRENFYSISTNAILELPFPILSFDI